MRKLTHEIYTNYIQSSYFKPIKLQKPPTQDMGEINKAYKLKTKTKWKAEAFITQKGSTKTNI